MGDAHKAQDATSTAGPDRTGELASLGLAIGITVGVDDEAGTYRIIGVGKDGSVSAVGGPGRRWRAFRPEWCFPATRVNRTGRTVPGRLPPERRGLRRAWRAEHGFDRPDPR